MDIIEGFRNSLAALDDSMEKTVFLSQVKVLEKEVMQEIRQLNFSPWKKGSGLRISHYLSAVKDEVILRLIRYIGGIPQGISIVAVGGYGRDEMSPGSDIDILLIHRDNLDPKNFANSLFYLLWDLDYKLGNSVRTVKNIIEHSMDDITLLTALFEARLLAGSPELLEEMYRQLNKVLHSRRETYIREKLAEFHELSKKTAYAVLHKEPNLKENPGGLRHVHLARWAMFAFRGKGGMTALQEVLPAVLYKKLAVAYDFILYIRNMLHFLAGRKEDTLFIDNHQAVAACLGYGGDDYSKVMRLMHRVYTKSMDIFLISSHAVDILYYQQKKGFRKKLSPHTYVQDRILFVHAEKPVSILEGFSLIEECVGNDYLYSYSLIDYLRRCSLRIDAPDRKDKSVFNRFLDILSLPNSYSALTLMKLSGFLYRYIRYFSRIRYYIIYNPFHKFTVDEHSLEAVWGLERLLTRDYPSFEKEKFKDLISLAERHSSALWIIKLALLLHDIGKAWPGEHTRNGVEIAERIFEEMPLSYRYREVIKFLIRNHLLLTEISRRSDIQNEEVILDLTERFSLTPYPVEYLDYLYLLTYADILATNPTNYTGYVAALLRQLYHRTREVLKDRAALISDRDFLQNAINQAVELYESADIGDFVAALGIRYATVNTAPEMCSDYRALQDTRSGKLSISVSHFNDVLQVKVFAPDHMGLFAQLAGILLLNGANILRANIYTYADTAFDVFFINDIFGANLTKDNMQAELESWVSRVQESVDKFLRDDPQLMNRITALRSQVKALPEVFRSEAAVSFTLREKTEYLVGVSGTDRPALLFDICRYFSQQGMTIRSAIIDTIGWHIKDVFVIDTGKLLDESEKDRHREKLISLLDLQD